MRKIPNRLWDAIGEIAKMQHPSVANILRNRGFGHEAGKLEELTEAYQQAKDKEDNRHARQRSHFPR